MGMSMLAVAFSFTGAAAQQSPQPAVGSKPLLVTQPAYAGMRFYVYQPAGIPDNWYLTFDGYPVWKNFDGTWLYGFASGSSLIPTNYVVGSVIPSLAGLLPYVTGIHAIPFQPFPAVTRAIPAPPPE